MWRERCVYRQGAKGRQGRSNYLQNSRCDHDALTCNRVSGWYLVLFRAGISRDHRENSLTTRIPPLRYDKRAPCPRNCVSKIDVVRIERGFGILE